MLSNLGDIGSFESNFDSAYIEATLKKLNSEIEDESVQQKDYPSLITSTINKL